MSAVRSRVHHGVAQWRIKNPKLDCFLIQHYSDHAPFTYGTTQAKDYWRRPRATSMAVDSRRRRRPARSASAIDPVVVGGRELQHCWGPFFSKTTMPCLARYWSIKTFHKFSTTTNCMQCSQVVRSAVASLSSILYIPLCVCLSCKYLHPQTSQWRGSYIHVALSAAMCEPYRKKSRGAMVISQLGYSRLRLFPD